jgi:type VI protein secretion system component Hcp
MPIFMHFEGLDRRAIVNGGVTVAGYQGWVEVDSIITEPQQAAAGSQHPIFTFKKHVDKSTPAGDGPGLTSGQQQAAGKAKYPVFTFKKEIDTATPQLAALALTSAPLVVTLAKLGARAGPPVEAVLHDAVLARLGASVLTTRGRPLPAETFQIVCASVAHRHTGAPQDIGLLAQRLGAITG